jgi:hypothetical protein
MKTNDVTLKLIFGAIIFLFSLALAYFTANYVSQSNLLDYWLTLFLFGAGYLIVGMVIAQIYSISFGFLFSADVLILHLLFTNFGHWQDTSKSLAVLGILIVLYITAYLKFPDGKSTGASAK